MRRVYAVSEIEFHGPGLTALATDKDLRFLITPNHPTNAEPGVLFALSRHVGQRFHFISNREAFDRAGGIFGKILQRLNVYSLVRGAPDRESFRFTRALLGKAGTRLVIFPEGEVYSQNDTLLPFQSGVFQLAFFAIDDMQKEGSDGNLFILPVAVKYRFLGDMSAPIERSLNAIEKQLGLRPDASLDAYQRLRRVGEEVISATEVVYGIDKVAKDLDTRIATVKEAMVHRVATALDLDPSEVSGTLADKMRFLINEVYSVTKEETVPDSIYEVRLHEQERDHVAPLMHDLDRLSNWIAVRDNYVAEKPSPERMVDTLRRLEFEVFGKPRTNGNRKAVVHVAAPFDLNEYAESYRHDKKSTVLDVTRRVEDTVQKMLNEMAL